MSSEGLGINEGDVLYLFDSPERLDEQDQHIVDFLQSHSAATDLLIFYVGHAGFLFDREYFLALRSTIRGREPTTGFRIKALAYTIDLHFANRRVFLILDCCFAGEAVDDFQFEGSSAVSRVIETQSREALRASGTSLMVASSKDEPAVAPSGAEYTMFSECFLDILRNGIPGAGALLTLNEIGDAVEVLLRERFGQRAVRPEVHSPRQRGADIAKRIQLFPNPAFVPPAPAKLPEYVATALESQFSGARRDAVGELGNLLKSDNIELAELARESLMALAASDDSVTVRTLAADALAREGAPPTDLKQSTTSSSAPASPPIAPSERSTKEVITSAPLPKQPAHEDRAPRAPPRKPQAQETTDSSSHANPAFGRQRKVVLLDSALVGVAGGIIAFAMVAAQLLHGGLRFVLACSAVAAFVYLIALVFRHLRPIILLLASALIGCLFLSLIDSLAYFWRYESEYIPEALGDPYFWSFFFSEFFSSPMRLLFTAIVAALSFALIRYRFAH